MKIESIYNYAFVIGLAMNFLFLFSANAQENVKIAGLITDTNGEVIIGASIKDLKSGSGTISNIDGNFTLNTSIGSTLEIGYIGYTSQKIQVKNDKFLKVILEEDVVALGDVVVIGYGSQKKETLTGAVSNLKVDEIVKTKAPSLAQAIQGKVAGLRIRQQNGEPGRFSSSINIRGFGEPLFVVDGVVRDGSSQFQKINPEDIESISFLKDASAAIYGMNSANGAIIITTKKGKSSKPRITLNTNLGISSPTNVPKMANAAQYMTMRNEAELNVGRPAYITKDELLKWQQGAPGYRSTDLYDAVFNKHALQTQTTLSLEGGNEKINYYGSFAYQTDNSVLKNDAMKYDKYTFRSNVDMMITKGLKATINVGGRYDTTNRPWYNFFEIFKATRVGIPTIPIYANDNPNYYSTYPVVINPVAMIDTDYTGGVTEKERNLQTQFSLEYDIPYIEGLKVKGSLFYDFNTYNYKAVRKGFSTYSYNDYTGEYSESPNNYPALVQNNRSDNERLDMQFQTNYNRTFGNHSLGITYVFERRELRWNGMNGERKYDVFTLPELDFGREKDQVVSGSSGHEAFLSHIGRLTYDYAGKYMAEFACRYDGSYRYAPGSRWAFFPTASIGWRVSEEQFIKDNFNFIDNLKLRVSVGRSGQDAGDPFQYYPGYSLNNGGYVFSKDEYTKGIGSPTLINNNLTWINVNMYNIGIDLSILNRLFAVEFDIYQRDRDGLLAQRYASLPNTFGASLPQENLNGDRTRGIEFTLTHSKKIFDFYYSVSGNVNLARTQNRYIESAPFKSSMDRWRNQAAYRWHNVVWGYQIDGRFQNFDQINTYPIQNGDMANSKELPGDFIIKDLNGDGMVDGWDTTPLFWGGDPLLHYGFNVEASWKNFDFYALFQGSAMYTIQFDEVYARMLCFKGGNTPEYFYDRWHLEDPYDPNSKWIPGEWPAVRMEQDMGSFYTRNSEVWRKNASYLRMKTIELGYTFSPKLMSRLGLGSLRVYVNANNLFTICDPFVKPFDPEKIEGDFSAGLNYPLNKSFNFGLTLNL